MTDSESNNVDPSARDARESQLEAIVEMTDDGVITIDRDGIVFMFNSAAEEIFGYEREEVVGENVSMLMPEPYAEEHDGYLQRYLETGDPHIIGYGREVEGQRKNGETFPLDLSVREFEAEGNPFFAGFVRDLSEERRLQQEVRQVQKMEAIGTLTTGVAHDFNNVLMGISGHAQMALAQIDDEHPAREHVEGVKKAVARGAGLTRRLLAFTRSENGEGRAIPVDAVVEDLQDLFRPLVSDQVDLTLELDADGAWIECEPGHLDQILLNLVVNARDACERGAEVRVRTEVRRIDSFRAVDVGELHAGRYSVIEVADDGCGMEPETLEHIFEPFFSTKSVGEGTGLGLATVFGIVRQWNGAIEVETAPGDGTTFRVYFEALSRSESELEPPSQEARPEELARAVEEGEAPRVLVLDDEPRVRSVLGNYLESGGYEPVAAENATEALERVRREEIRAAVVDLVLGEENGRDVAGRLQEQIADLPVVFVSGFAEPAANNEFFDLGSELLQKPFSEETLLTAVGRAIEREGERATDEAEFEPAEPERRRLLVVEDNDIARHATCELLQEEGFETLEAESGADALASASDVDAFEAAIVDLTLPDGVGTELAGQLRSMLGDLPIVFVSGADAGEPIVAEAIEQPQTTFLQKPIDLDRLLSSLRSVAAE